jgi:hypothetical protein
MEGWYSTKCRLTWKMRATKSHRIYFQLAPSMLPIGEIGFGLLHTPRKVMIEEPNENFVKRMGDRSEGCYPHLAAQVVGMVGNGLLKTPTKFDATVTSPKANPVSGNSGSLAQEIMCGFGMLPTPRQQSANSPSDHGQGGMDLQTFVQKNLIPTPAKRDTKGSNSMEHLNRETDGNSHQDQLPNFIKLKTGSSSQLNPQFVAEMMGFPTDWTELPFLSGESSASEPTEMP